jgi:hypothetical protein
VRTRPKRRRGRQRVRGDRLTVRLTFNEIGEIGRTVAERPGVETCNAQTPWIGVDSDYQQLGGVRVPSHGEVHWESSDSPVTLARQGHV